MRIKIQTQSMYHDHEHGIFNICNRISWSDDRFRGKDPLRTNMVGTIALTNTTSDTNPPGLKLSKAA